MNRLILSLIVSSAMLATASAQGQDHSDLPPILQKFAHARHTSRYSGVRTVEFKRDGERVRHVEIVLKDGIRSRTEFPDDSPYAGQIIVDDGKQRMHFYPDRNEIEVEPERVRDASSGRGEEQGGDGGHDQHKLNRVVTAGGNIAGFDTQEVTVADPNGNVVQQMWIEPRSGVRLKLVLFDRVGSQAGSYEFSKINFHPTFATGDFRIDRKGAVIVSPELQARRMAEKLGLTPLVLGTGSGFVLQNARIMHPDQKDVLAQTYMGAGGRFTFFQLRGSLDQNRLSRFAHGRLSTYSWSRGQESFALIGNLTSQQLGQIAKTLGDR
jgi:outer membrane lipoprotein-sorting protein